MRTYSAIETMKLELQRIGYEMSRCINDWGFVIDKYKYQELMREQEKFRESINWMEKLYRKDRN